MRITRSGLRRIIAEESARILAETKKNPHERIPGGNQARIEAGFDEEPEEEDWEDADKTDEEWAEEQLQGVMDMYGHPDPYGDDEALKMGYEYDGAGGWIKPGLKEGEGHSGGVYDMVSSMNPAFVPALKKALSIVVNKYGKMPTFSGKKAAVKRAEWLADVAVDVNYKVEELLAADPDAAAEWDDMGYSDAVDEYNSLLDAEIERLAAEEEMTRDEREAAEELERSEYEETERSLSHPSNFIELEEGDDDIQGDAEDPYADTESSYRKHKAFWGGEPGSSLKASHSDFDDVRGSAGGVPRFVSGGAKGRPARIRGADIDSGYDDEVTDDSLSESRWAKLAGILEG